MNRYYKYLMPIVLLPTLNVWSQGIKITSGTTLKVAEAPYTIVLYGDMDFENIAPIDASLLKIKVSGSTNNSIKGSGDLTIKELLVQKTDGNTVALEKNILITDNVNFVSGLIDLNGMDLVLADSASLINESNNSRIMGNAGAVQITQNLNAPLAENPGKLGIIITSGANWGSTTIRRGHTEYTSGSGGTSILRNYKITPTNNTALNAFLRMYYFNAELNSLDENSLDFFRSDDEGIVWSNIGLVGRDTVANFVNINGVNTMSMFTLSTTENPLPIILTHWTANCDNGLVSLEWRISNPQSTQSFIVEKSKDAQNWEVVTSSIAINTDPSFIYTIKDKNPQTAFYRLVSKSEDNSIYYSPIQKVYCEDDAPTFKLIQNPVKGDVKIQVSSIIGMETKFEILDMQGKILINHSKKIEAGVSNIVLDINSIPAGMYIIRISNNINQVWHAKFINQ